MRRNSDRRIVMMILAGASPHRMSVLVRGWALRVHMAPIATVTTARIVSAVATTSATSHATSVATTTSAIA